MGMGKLLCKLFGHKWGLAWRGTHGEGYEFEANKCVRCGYQEGWYINTPFGEHRVAPWRPLKEEDGSPVVWKD